MNGTKLPFAAAQRETVDRDAPVPAGAHANRPARSTGAKRSGRPRVLVLAQLPPPEHGAAAVNRQVVTSPLLSEAFDMTVVPIAMSEDLARIRKFDLIKIWRSLKLFGAAARRLFGRARPDVVYFTLSPAGWAFYRDIALIAMIRLSGTRCVYHLHGRGVAASIEKAPWQRHLYHFAFARAFVIVLGGTLRDDVKDVAPKDRIFVVPNGIQDTTALEPDACRRRPATLHHSPPRVLFLSNLLKEKGPLILLEALSIVAERGIRFEAQLAGAWRYPISEESLGEQVRRLGLQNRVALLGPVYGAPKARLLSEADVFVLPTYHRHEALPLAVIEAMMHGLAVITTRVGALPEIIADQENGELIEPGNVAQLASALEKLLTDPELRARYGRAARRKYEADLTAQRFELRLKEALLQIAARP
jgi:glycosyltransferase involved in cell wall biosynthesis